MFIIFYRGNINLSQVSKYFDVFRHFLFFENFNTNIYFMVATTKTTPVSKGEIQETLLTPRFYTTDFKEMSELDISSNEAEIKAIVEEFRVDYNRDHFIRDKEFSNTWENFDDATRNIFIEFLERSCTAEFSGFLLYKEISRNLRKSNPLLAEGFSFMSRDEARHAGFLNKAMSDFNISLDFMVFLQRLVNILSLHLNLFFMQLTYQKKLGIGVILLFSVI